LPSNVGDVDTYIFLRGTMCSIRYVCTIPHTINYISDLRRLL